jgi:hypothetical protein
VSHHPNLRPAPPFENGNAIAVTHGAYSRLRLSEPAGDTADVVRELVPLNHDADEPTIQTFAFVLEQLRAAGEALEQARGTGRRDKLLRLSQDANGWANTALRFAKELGLTPRARAELGLDLARARAAVRFDWSRLTSAEKSTVDRLISKAETHEGTFDE